MIYLDQRHSISTKLRSNVGSSCLEYGYKFLVSYEFLVYLSHDDQRCYEVKQ